MVDSIYVSASSYLIEENGGTLQMNADVFPSYAANMDVEWSVEDNGTGTTIDTTGLLQANPTAAGDGTVRVKATAKDGSGVFDTVDVIITNQNAAFVEFINLSHDGDFPEILVRWSM